MVTTSQKPVVDIHKIKRKESKLNTKKMSSNLKGRQQEKKRTKNNKINPPKLIKWH